MSDKELLKTIQNDIKNIDKMLKEKQHGQRTIYIINT